MASDVIGEGGGIELLALKGLNGALPSATFEEGDSYGASSKAVVNADGTITLSSRPNNNKLRVKFDGKDGTVTNISKLTGLYYIDTSNIGDSAVPSELSAIAPDSKTFTGKAGKQATVYLLDGTGNPVKDKEGKDITATANDAGEFTMNLPENLTLGQKFNLKAKEPSSFESGMVEVAVAEKQTSKVPTIVQELGEIKGVAGPNAEVVLVDKDGTPIKDGGKEVKTIADADGHYVIDLPAGVKDGDVVGVIATEKDKKPANSETITLDRTNAAITPIADQNGITNVALTPIPVIVDDEKAAVEVTGLPKGVTYNPDTKQIEGTPEVAGNFDVTVKATDEAGNVATETFKLAVKEQETSTTPTIKQDGDQVKGVAGPNAEVVLVDKDGAPIKDGDKVVKVTADADGNYVIDLPAGVKDGDVVGV
ncbi:MAG: Ig-like domain-containing protein, partial [Anaerovoracaceae bacterium]